MNTVSSGKLLSPLTRFPFYADIHKGHVMAKSHFYGFIQGSAENPASRIGRKDCPLSAELAGWNGRINVRVWHNATKGVDEFQVSLRPHWNEDVGGTESCKVIASGILDHRALKDPYIPALIA